MIPRRIGLIERKVCLMSLPQVQVRSFFNFPKRSSEVLGAVESTADNEPDNPRKQAALYRVSSKSRIFYLNCLDVAGSG